MRFISRHVVVLLALCLFTNAAPAVEVGEQLERTGRLELLVTQNIDNLHQRAGSTAVTAMQGELTKIRHVRTGEVLPWAHDVVETETSWRPHVVWFGERTIGLDATMEMLSAADVFLAIGTSGTVYPANQFAMVAKASGAATVEINLEPSGVAFDRSLIGPATEQVPQFVDLLISLLDSSVDSL